MVYTELTHGVREAYGKNFRLDKAAEPPPAKHQDAKANEATKTDTESAERTDNGAELLKIVEPMEQLMNSVGVDISFRIDEETKQVQAEVRTPDGERVIRKVPSDEILKLAASIRELTQSHDTFVERTL